MLCGSKAGRNERKHALPDVQHNSFATQILAHVVDLPFKRPCARLLSIFC